MNIIAVDDERLALQMLVSTINEVLPAAKVHAFAAGKDALDFACDNTVDIAFLDIELYDIQGVALAKKLKKIHP
ncbi:MAG: response regulator, partial [Angelakisella sp.]